MITIGRGDVVFVDLDGAKGHEKKNDTRINARMCLVVQNDRGNAVSPLTIVAPITSIEQYKALPVQVAVLSPDLGPLHHDSTIECGQIRTVDRTERVTKNIGPLPAHVMAMVDEALKASLGIP